MSNGKVEDRKWNTILSVICFWPNNLKELVFTIHPHQICPFLKIFLQSSEINLSSPLTYVKFPVSTVNVSCYSEVLC